MKSSEITKVINEIKEGVEKSELGIISYTQNDGKTVMNYMPAQAFLSILNSVIPKNLGVGGSVTMEEPKEPWQK